MCTGEDSEPRRADKEALLEKQVDERRANGDAPIGTGCIKMPPGYAIMWSCTTEQCYLLRWDGLENGPTARRWWCYHWARDDNERMLKLTESGL